MERVYLGALHRPAAVCRPSRTSPFSLENGPGRPPSSIKRRFRDLIDLHGVGVLEELMLGELEVPVKFVPECPECGHKGDAEQFAKAMKEAAFQASVSATAKASDRNRAIDIASKIGGLQEKDSYDREVVRAWPRLF